MTKKRGGRVAPLENKIVAAALIVVFAGVLFVVLVGDYVEDAFMEGVNFGSVANVFTSIAQGTLSVVSASGYLGIFVLMLLESSSFPIPSEIILPFSGYLASQDHLSLWLIVLVATVAALAGSLIDYYLGLLLGLDRIKNLRYLPIKDRQLDSAVKWFDRYGPEAVLGVRLIPGFRTLISFPAGIVRMSKTKFLLYTALGCVLWDAILTSAGFYAGAHWEETLTAIRDLTIVAVIALPLVLILYYVVSKRRHERQKS